MARIRTIKPEFFKNEALAMAEMETKLPLRVAFAGLWCCADREGRFHWRPNRLKVDIMPYDPFDFGQILDELHRIGFVKRYEHDGEQFGYIPTWSKHQRVNMREPESELPVPSTCTHVHARAMQMHACVEGKGREGKGMEGNGVNNNILSDVVCHPPSADEPATHKKSVDDCPHQDIIALYHEILPNCLQVKLWGEDRRRMLRARWREDKKFQSLDFWRGLFLHVREDPFLMGKRYSPDRGPFVLTLPRLLGPKIFANIIENFYLKREVLATENGRPLP